MTNVTTATIRTVVPTSWAAVLVLLASKLGLALDQTTATIAVPIVAGVVYRVGRVVESVCPRWVAYVIFGSPWTPTYAKQP
jgi:nitrate/nitrite transporter NarK